jgi:GNAT superfamily N-acetyltransferase
MHACGHDGHTAMLLSAARHLAATRQFDGTVHAVFQPAEEGLAGARKMLDDGFLDLFPCDAMFGMHNAPGIPEGQFMAVPGFAMASGDTCIITVHGVGGHGAFPQAAVDPIVVGSAIVMALQTIVSRNVGPLQTGIVTVGAFLAGDAPNVIPGTAELRLTVRAMQPDVRDLLEKRITEIATAQAQTFGARAEVHYIRRYPVLQNEPGARLAGRCGRRGPAGARDRQRRFRVLPRKSAWLLHQHRQRRGQRGRLHGAQRRVRLQRPHSVDWRDLLGQAGGAVVVQRTPAPDGMNTAAFTLRELRPGDMGWVIHRQMVLYAQEYGWNNEFEALAAEIGAKFIREFDPRWERCWIAEQGGQVVGAVFVVRQDDATAKLRMLYVEASTRGQGLGSRLVDECLQFARAAGYQRMVLWTNSVLVSARRIYEHAGFELLEEELHHSFGHELIGQVWGRDL